MVFGDGFGFAAFGFLWIASAVLSLALIVVLIMVAVRYLNRTSTPPAAGQWPGQTPAPPAPPARPDPFEILRERFARGEITLDDFETAKRALGYPSSAQPPRDAGAPPTS
jgi:uncharacterized membrane protein